MCLGRKWNSRDMNNSWENSSDGLREYVSGCTQLTLFSFLVVPWAFSTWHFAKNLHGSTWRVPWKKTLELNVNPRRLDDIYWRQFEVELTRLGAWIFLTEIRTTLRTYLVAHIVIMIAYTSKVGTLGPARVQLENMKVGKSEAVQKAGSKLYSRLSGKKSRKAKEIGYENDEESYSVY